MFGKDKEPQDEPLNWLEAAAVRRQEYRQRLRSAGITPRVSREMSNRGLKEKPMKENPK